MLVLGVEVSGDVVRRRPSSCRVLMVDTSLVVTGARFVINIAQEVLYLERWMLALAADCHLLIHTETLLLRIMHRRSDIGRPNTFNITAS